MKAAYLVIVLLLSDITLTSGDDPNYILLGGSGVVLGVIMLAVFQRLEMLLPFDPKQISRPNSSRSRSTGPQEWEKTTWQKSSLETFIKKESTANIISLLYQGIIFHSRTKWTCTVNAGGNVITSTAVDFLSAGKSREEIQMNSKGMDAQIHQSIFSYESSGFWQLVDHFVPFLPLERKHVRQCVLAEMASLKISVHHHPDLADKVVREMPFFPPEEKFFSIKGCKSVRQKLMLHINEMNIIE
ncbi:uncharacterized protein LOC130545233 isoform X2 [Triplophysa rosa]|nr:uncharacterized protein LOC130545233 isoform X2 [Triplophysa rosa]